MAKLKENAVKVLEYVREHQDENLTAADIAAGTGLEVRSVNGIVTSAFQRKGLMERIPAEITNDDGTHKAIKVIKLTEAGLEFNEEDDSEEDAE